MEEKFPRLGVTAYALMAAGGDFGASVAPQLLGAIADGIAVSPWAEKMAPALSMTAEQLGMKSGMLAASVFPLLGVILLLYMKQYFKKHSAL